MTTQKKNIAKRVGGYFVNEAKKMFSYKAHKETVLYIKDTAVALATPAKKEREETFDEAVKRKGLNENQIEASLKYHKVAFSVYFAFFLLTFIAIVFSATTNNWQNMLGSMGVFFIFSALCFRFSFRCFQIRNRTLGQLEYFLLSPKQWLPY